jgi:hypothetical protein
MMTERNKDLEEKEEINSLALRKKTSDIKELESKKQNLLFEVDKFKLELALC